MATKAHVASLDALRDFRAALIVYLNEARPVLDGVSSDVTRTRLWLQNDQRLHWENQVRRRARALEEAQQELFSSRVSHLQQATAANQIAVQKAKRSLEEAESKLRQIKHRSRAFDSQVEPLLRQLQQLQTLLVNDMPKAVASLAQTVETLEDYAHASQLHKPTVVSRSSPSVDQVEQRDSLLVEAEPASQKSGEAVTETNPDNSRSQTE